MNRLKELREDKDILQKEIAKDLNITQRNYSYFETGKTALTSDILEKIADYYNTSIDYLLYRNDQKSLIQNQLCKTKKFAVNPRIFYLSAKIFRTFPFILCIALSTDLGVLSNKVAISV